MPAGNLYCKGVIFMPEHQTDSNTEQLKRTFTFTYLPDVMLKDSRLNKHDILTALGIAFFTDKNRVSWPGVASIAEKARLSERQVQYSLSRLQEYGYLKIESRPGTSNLYTLVDNPEPHILQNPKGGAQHAHPGVHDMRGWGAQHAPEQEPENKNHKNNNQPAVVGKENQAVWEALRICGIEENSTVIGNLQTAKENGISSDQMPAFITYLKEQCPANQGAGWIINRLHNPDFARYFLDRQHEKEARRQEEEQNRRRRENWEREKEEIKQEKEEIQAEAKKRGIDPIQVLRERAKREKQAS
jgi:hypothetical protein